MRVFPHRRVLYYLVVFACGLVVHAGFIERVFGSGAADLLRRNSEAYAMMWLPLYWDLFAATADPDGRGGRAAVGSRRHVGLQLIWFGLLAVIATVLTTSALESVESALPQSIITLGEAFAATVVVTMYLGWTRRFFPGPPGEIQGTALVPAPWRIGYYSTVMLVAVASEQSWLADALGDGIAQWLQINTEAYAAMILIPLFFDVVAASAKSGIRLVWYSGLVAMPIAVQTGLVDGVLPESIVGWLGTTTEAFLAAFVISAYFDFIRGRMSEHDHVSAARKVPDGFAEETG